MANGSWLAKSLQSFGVIESSQTGGRRSTLSVGRINLNATDLVSV